MNEKILAQGYLSKKRAHDGEVKCCCKGLGLAIQYSHDADAHAGVTWAELLPHIAEFWHLVCTRLDARSRAGRLKQWLNFLRRRYPQAETAYQQLKTINDPAQIDAWLAQQPYSTLAPEALTTLAMRS